MNIYRGVRIPERLQTTEHLAAKTYAFANALSAGRWHQGNVPKVEITRSIAEELGSKYTLNNEGVEPIHTEITISFSAIKRLIENSNGDLMLAPTYMVTSTTTQDIRKNEIPEVVLDEIFENKEEDDHLVDDLMEATGLDADDITAENFDELELRRVQEDEYTINHLGELRDYSANYSYTFDDVEVHRVGYRHSNSEITWRPMSLADGTEGEGKPFILLALNEDTIKDEVRNIDAAYTEYMETEFVREVTEFGGLSKEEHIRRVLGMISMVSGGFVDFPKRRSGAKK